MTWLHHWWVNIGLNNGLVSSGNKPLPWPMFSKLFMPLSRTNELIYSQTVAELADFYLVVSMASNLIFRKQRYSGRRRSYIYPTWQCQIAISSTLIRGLCRHGYSFALATLGGTPSVTVVDVGSLGPRALGSRAHVSSLCFADRAMKQSVMHVPGYAAVSATSGSQWHKTMLGQSHHGINSYKGWHKQRNLSNHFPVCMMYTAFTGRLDCTKIGDVTHKNSPGRNTTGRTLRVSDSPGVEPTPGSTDRTQGVCGVVGLDCANGLEWEI